MADDSRAPYVAAMGERLGEQFHALWLDVTWLHIKWSQFVEIFGATPERIDLLNRAAPSFFRIVEDIFWQDIMLHLTRLTDPAKSLGKENLSIIGLADLISDAETSESVRTFVKIAKDRTKFCRDWRNRHIAHRDLSLALREDASPLESASRDDVGEALASISNVMYTVRRAYMGSSPTFQAGHTIGGAMDLLRVLEADEPFEMANLYPRTTGLPMTVWVSPRGNVRHDAQIKVNMAHGNQLVIDNTAVVGVRPAPHLIAGRLSAADEQAVYSWITLNAPAIVAYWDGNIDTAELIQTLKPPPPHL